MTYYKHSVSAVIVYFRKRKVTINMIFYGLASLLQYTTIAKRPIGLSPRLIFKLLPVKIYTKIYSNWCSRLGVI